MRYLVFILSLAACHKDIAFVDADARLHFVSTDEKGAAETTLSKRALADRVELVTCFDPYYKREKRFWAIPIAPVLLRAFPGVDVASASLVLRARDGYAVPLRGSRLLDGTAYLALADADLPSGWEPIGPRRADAAPFYLIWKGPDRVDLERFPRPWALEQIERAPSGTLYPHAIPIGGSRPAQHGYELFSHDCIHCHAINREGGSVGPELNVPQSIVEYRPRDQIRAYIRNPLQFRYGGMPAHPHLSDGDLDDLIAYFDDMKSMKHDPDKAL